MFGGLILNKNYLEYNAKVSVRNSVANRNNLRLVKKPEENNAKRTNDQFAKIGNYYVKSHNFNNSNYRSLTEEADKISLIESENRENDSLINKKGGIKIIKSINLINSRKCKSWKFQEKPSS